MILLIKIFFCFVLNSQFSGRIQLPGKADTAVIKNSYFRAKLVSASCVLKELVHVLAVRILSSGCTRVTLGCGSSNSFASVMFSKHLTCIRSFKHGTPLYFMLLKINLGGKKNLFTEIDSLVCLKQFFARCCT